MNHETHNKLIDGAVDDGQYNVITAQLETQTISQSTRSNIFVSLCTIWFSHAPLLLTCRIPPTCPRPNRAAGVPPTPFRSHHTHKIEQVTKRPQVRDVLPANSGWVITIHSPTKHRCPPPTTRLIGCPIAPPLHSPSATPLQHVVERPCIARLAAHPPHPCCPKPPPCPPSGIPPRQCTHPPTPQRTQLDVCQLYARSGRGAACTRQSQPIRRRHLHHPCWCTCTSAHATTQSITQSIPPAHHQPATTFVSWALC